MEWCCQPAKFRFDDRLSYGAFLVAGLKPEVDEVRFYAGFNMAHRKDYSDVLGAIQAAKAALEAESISNFKLSACRCVHFCSFCGANLREHYGVDGGILRDDEYVRQMTSTT
jgi:hypothetical protein